MSAGIQESGCDEKVAMLRGKSIRIGMMAWCVT